MSKKKTDTTNQLDILCSIWILACNDVNPQITYQGISSRLGLADDFDVRALVHSRGELFLKQTPQSQLDNWKAEMKQNKHLPTWIRNIQDSNSRTEKINSLTSTDVFRSQFRSEANSSRSDIEIINWGLQHIDRLRKAELETKQERTRFFTSVVIPIFSTVVAIIAVVSSFYVQYTNNQNQTILKHYEVELKPKQDAYSNFMIEVSNLFFASYQNDSIHNSIEDYNKSLYKLEGSYYLLEPFLQNEERDTIWKKYKSFSAMCTSMLDNEDAKFDGINSFEDHKDYFRNHLYKSLFTSDKENKEQKKR